MAVNSDILFRSNMPDVNQQFNNALTTIGKMRDLKRAQELAPLQQQLMQQRVDSGQQSQQQEALKARAESVIQGAMEILPDLRADNSAAALDKLIRRREFLVSQEIDTSDTDAAIAMMQTPEGQIQLTNDAENLIAQAQQSGVNLTPDQREFQQFAAMPEETEQQKLLKKQFGRLIGAESKAAGLDERLQFEKDKQQIVGDIKVEQDVVKAGGSEEAKLKKQLKFKPEIMRAVKAAELEAKGRGESANDLIKRKAAMPGLEKVVGELKVLADEATFTLTGKAFNAIAKQFGYSTKGGTARASMVAMVDNQVLPLLKPIFGAAFTENEGTRLRNAFLDPDSTPESRKVSLDAFLGQMKRNVEALENEGQAANETTANKDFSGFKIISVDE